MLLHYMCRNLCKNQISTLWSLFAKPKTSRLMWQIFLNIVRALNVVFHSDFISLYSCLATLRILQLRSLCTAYWARWLCKTMMCNGINSLNSDNVTNHFGLSSNMKMSTGLWSFLESTILSSPTSRGCSRSITQGSLPSSSKLDIKSLSIYISLTHFSANLFHFYQASFISLIT